MNITTARKALASARRHLRKQPGDRGRLFRVPGHPGIWSDGRSWVVDVDGGQDWQVSGKDLVKARWPA